jgi:hypothetical protein
MKHYFLGSFVLIIGIILAVFFKEAHFYTFFSVGLFLIFLEIYKHIVHHTLFKKWSLWEHVAFWGALLVVSIVIDILGIRLGYWHYPNYVTTMDTIVKFTFEWCIALMYVTLGFFIGVAIFQKHHVRKWLAYFGSLIIIVIPLGLITEFFNHSASSWVVTSMPFSDYSIHGYYVIFQTLGYWLMALIPWIIYMIITSFFKKKNS